MPAVIITFHLHQSSQEEWLRHLKRPDYNHALSRMVLLVVSTEKGVKPVISLQACQHSSLYEYARQAFSFPKYYFLKKLLHPFTLRHSILIFSILRVKDCPSHPSLKHLWDVNRLFGDHNVEFLSGNLIFSFRNPWFSIRFFRSTPQPCRKIFPYGNGHHRNSAEKYL